MAASPCKSTGKCLHAKYILISSQTLKCLRARRPRALHLNLTCDVIYTWRMSWYYYESKGVHGDSEKGEAIRVKHYEKGASLDQNLVFGLACDIHLDHPKHHGKFRPFHSSTPLWRNKERSLDHGTNHTSYSMPWVSQLQIYKWTYSCNVYRMKHLRMHRMHHSNGRIRP